MDFHIALEPQGDRLILLVRGELDEYSGQELVQVVVDVINEYEDEIVEVDLAGVGFMDSRGLGQLLNACAHVERAGRPVCVTNPSLHADRVLRTAGVGERFGDRWR